MKRFSVDVDSVIIVVRHDGRVGIASSPDGVAEVAVVENPAGDCEESPNEDVVQSSRAEFDPTSTAVEIVSPPK